MMVIIQSIRNVNEIFQRGCACLSQYLSLCCKKFTEFISLIRPSIGVEVTLPESMNRTEGDTFEVCASVDAVYPMRERDVILMFTLTPDSMFASKCPRLGQLG